MATATSRSFRIPRWLATAVPFLAILAMAGAFLLWDPASTLRSIPPIETLAVERTVLTPGEVKLDLRNDGPDEVRIAQVLVNDAYWNFTIDDPTLGRLETAELKIPYPWEDGMPVNVAMLTSTGVTIEHEIEAAALTPEADTKTFAIYGLLGVYIGVIPIAIGLLWFPALRRVSPSWLGFFLAFTVGLLAFLLVDTVAEGFEIAAETAVVLNGVGLFAIGALLAVAVLTWFETWLQGRTKSDVAGGLALAYLIATGIGLHNMGEGLAVGAALAAGEAALGTYLILGFALHNTTEGLAIVAPLGGEGRRPHLGHFAAMGLIAGLPTVGGAWIGGFAFSPALAAFEFGVAAGAIAQVIWKISGGLNRNRTASSGLRAAGFVTGLVVMYATGLLTA